MIDMLFNVLFWIIAIAICGALFLLTGLIIFVALNNKNEDEDNKDEYV